ncbi:MAG TPA: enoyl-CoA hydratase/isomerase family protein [Dehalococcoidia bacterium]
MAYENLIYEKHGNIAVATLNRPESLNALSRNLQLEMLEVCREVKEDDGVRVLIWTGAGRGFCSGADVSGAGARMAAGANGGAAEPPPTPSQNSRLDEMSWVGRQAMAVYGLDKPTIAAMNGVAAGAGMSLSLACDMRIGSTNARFRTVFLERNLSPDSGMSIFLPRILGYARAFDLIMTSRDVDAQEAYRLGLLDRLVEPEKLMEEAMTVAGQLAKWPPLASRSAKRVIQQNLELTFEQGLRNEIRGIDFGRRSPNDQRESAMSRVERREPNFTGT